MPLALWTTPLPLPGPRPTRARFPCAPTWGGGPSLPANKADCVQARLTDLAGTSPATGFSLVASTNTWVATATVLTADPLDGDPAAQLGDVTLAHAVEIDNSGGASQGALD